VVALLLRNIFIDYNTGRHVRIYSKMLTAKELREALRRGEIPVRIKL
jgi:hypothetical protein